jgi:hypothetical protein
VRQRSSNFRATCRTRSTVTIQTVTTVLGRHGLSVRSYDIERVPTLLGAHGRAAYGASPHDGFGRPLRGTRGRPLIQLSCLALRNLHTAVITIFHEIAHHRSYRTFGHPGTEADAELYGQRMYYEFTRQRA